MKKGEQYSHYCGTELNDIMSSISLCMKLEGEEREEWGNHAKQRLKDLRNKIAELDKINEFKY